MTSDPRITRARALRRDATVEERRIWGLLTPLNRARRAHFRRQAVIGPYTVDFADLSRRLVIEVDGSQHGGPADMARDAWLTAQGFRVLRFWNSEVRDRIEGVHTRIAEALDMAAAPHPLPPHKGEGSSVRPTAVMADPAKAQGASLPLVGRERVGVPRPSPDTTGE